MDAMTYRFTWDGYLARVNACAAEAKAYVARMERGGVAFPTGSTLAALAAAEGAVVEAEHELAEIKRLGWWLSGYIGQREDMDATGLSLALR